MTSDSYPGPSGPGNWLDALTLDELDELSSAQSGELKTWLLDESRAGRLSVLQREVPVLNPTMMRTIKPRGSSGAERPQDTDLFGRPLSVMRPKPAAPDHTTYPVKPTTEYRVTKQEFAKVAADAHARGWSEGLQRGTGVDPNPEPETQESDVGPDEVFSTKQMAAHLERLGFAGANSALSRIERKPWLADCRVSGIGQRVSYSKNKTVKAFHDHGITRSDGAMKQSPHLREVTAPGVEVIKVR